MPGRVAVLTRHSGRLLAVSFALLLVSSVVVGPAVAAGLSSTDARASGNAGSYGSPSALGAEAGFVQTNETDGNETDGNETDVPTIGGHQPRDVDGDGRYEDVTGDGVLGQRDVTVFFRYQHRDVMKRPTLFDFSGNGQVTHGDVVVLFDYVALRDPSLIDHRWPPDADRDGLPTAFEEDVLGTDPHDSDSNSTYTAHNESGNNVSDADEDFSDNGLSATVAHERGLDPFSNDTDDDWLPDTVELRYAGVNATVPDTDGDGTLDGADDLDDDGLKNVAEVEHGTDLSAADTDGDGLDDGREVDLGTDPLDRDSDDDGLTDAEELEFDTDPAVADTDGDGTEDGNETLERTVEDEDTGVTVAVRGEGAVDAQISEQANAADEANITAAPTVRIQSESAFENATVTLPIDEDVGADTDVTIRKWDPSEGGSWRTVPTSVDHQTGTATADVNSFSYVTVAIDDLWEDYFTETISIEDRHVAERYQANSSAGPGDRLWTSNRTVRGVRSGPTIVSETVFATGHDALYAINATTGAPLWDFTGADMGIRAAPTVANGSVFVGTENATVYSFDAETGDREWSHELSADWLESAPTVSDGTLYVGPVDGGTLHAINATDGTLEWTFEERSYDVESSPTVANGTVYVGTYYGNLTAVDAETGEREWTYEDIVDPVYSSPTVANGTVFVTADEALHAVDAATGERSWKLDVPADRSSPTVENGTVYIGTENGTLYAVNASTGRNIWTFDRPSDRIRSAPTVANDTVYVGSNDGQFYAVDASTGQQKWVYGGATSGIWTSPTVANGTAYVGAEGLHAIELAHNGTSEDSRVELGTFGHVGDRATDNASELDVVPEDEYDPPLVLADTSRNGIPDAVADANPRIPVMTVLDPFGTRSSRIDIDPTVRDSSGDGLADARGVDVSYEVFEENGTAKLRTRVDQTRYHPARIDTTGDGLTDREQLRGWQIQVVQNHTRAEELKRAFDNSALDPDLGEAFESRRVRADPLRNNSDSDGLSDVQEEELGTDPLQADTTGDRIDDETAFESPTEDPTVFTTTPPQVDGIREVDRGWELEESPIPHIPTVDYSFTYEFDVRDDAGVRLTEFSQEGIDSGTETYTGQTHVTEREKVFSRSESVLQYARGADARIRTEDVHGNNQTRLFRAQESLGHIVAENADGFVDKSTAGMLSGFTHGGAELPDMILMIYREPGKTVESFTRLGTTYAQIKMCPDTSGVSVDDLSDDTNPLTVSCVELAEQGDVPSSEVEFWSLLATSAVDGMLEEQHRSNPFELDVGETPREKVDYCLGDYYSGDAGSEQVVPNYVSDDYCTYAVGWFQGYAIWGIVETIAGSKGSLKAANSLDEVDDAIESAGRQVDDATLQSVVHGEDTPTPRVKRHVLAEGGPDVDSLPSNLRTSGKTVRGKAAMEAVSPDVRSALTRIQRSELLRHLAENPGTVRFVNDLGPEGTSRLFRMSFDDADAATLRANLFERYGRLEPGSALRDTFVRLTTDPAVRMSWIRAAGAEDVRPTSVEKTLRQVRDLESDGHGAVEFHRSNSLNEEFDGRPPHADDELVADFEINGEKTLYRLRDENAPVAGDWTVEEHILEEASTRSELLDRLALRPDEWGVDYTQVSRLETSEVEINTRLRVSTAGELDHRPGGARQYRILDGSDITEGWYSDAHLSEYVTIDS